MSVLQSQYTSNISDAQFVSPSHPSYNLVQNLTSSNITKDGINFLLSNVNDTYEGLASTLYNPQSLNVYNDDFYTGRTGYSRGWTTPTEEIGKTQNNTINGPALAFPPTLRKDCMFIQFGQVKRDRPSSRAIFEPNASVALPLPAQLMEQHDLALSSSDTGLIGAGINNIESIVQQIDKLRSGTKISSDELNQLMGEASGLGYYAARPLAAQFGLEQAVDILGERAGVIPNPHAAVFFHGVELRPAMEFSWLFSPRNREESSMLREIIKTFKQKSLPTLSGTSNGAPGNLMGYPHYVEIELSPQAGPPTGGRVNQSLPIYKRGLIQSINVNYSPSGLSFFHDDSPTFVVFSFVFKEVEIFTADDFADGGLERPDGSKFVNFVSGAVDEAISFISRNSGIATNPGNN